MSLVSTKNLLALALVALIVVQSASGATPARTVSITVNDMHCQNCAKKIAGKLYAVPGVVSVSTDLKSHTAFVTPQQKSDPSPQALWEAVEKAGFKPVKLVSPRGTFTATPNQ